MVPWHAGNFPAGAAFSERMEIFMLDLIVTFLIIGLVAAVLGFGGIAGASFAAAKFIFFLALILLLVSIVVGAGGYRRL
jgi:uncharacterized membrane protein YtjA (UPF0391 family)